MAADPTDEVKPLGAMLTSAPREWSSLDRDPTADIKVAIERFRAFSDDAKARRKGGELLMMPGEWLLMHPDDVRAMAVGWKGELPKAGERLTLQPGDIELRITEFVPRGNALIMPGVERVTLEGLLSIRGGRW